MLLFLNKNFVSLHIMFECYRKYQKICIVLIMSIFIVCVFADEYEDMRQFGHENNSVACMSIAEDDMDFDDDDDLPDVYSGRPTPLRLENFTITVRKTSERNQSKALRIGQVRLHFPRGKRIDSYNYTVSDNGSSGVGSLMPLFLYERNQFKDNITILL